MTTAQALAPIQRSTLRLWPGIAAVALQCLLWIIDPFIIDVDMMAAVFGGVLLGVVVLVWWLFFSRAPWLERIGAIVLMVVAIVGTYRVVHPSISNGMMGAMLPVFSVPLLCLALVSWAAASRRLSTPSRWAALVVALALACGVMTLLRTGGIGGANLADLHWRWTATPEERLLAAGDDDPVAPAALPAIVPQPVDSTPIATVPAATPAVVAPPRRRRPRPDGNGTQSRLARLSRTGAGQHRSRRAHRHELVANASRAVVAPADRARVVVIRGARQPALHTGAAR